MYKNMFLYVEVLRNIAFGPKGDATLSATNLCFHLLDIFSRAILF